MRVRKLVVAGMAALVGAAGAVVVAPPVAQAATITVTNTADDGSATSLRGVLETANAGDVVELTAGATYALTRCAYPGEVNGAVLMSIGELLVFEPVTINGNGATIRQTCESWRVLHTSADLTVNDVTITGGTSTRGGGGGIRVDGYINSTDLSDAGPADTDTQLVIRNSSIVGNCTASNGGGFKMNTAGDVTIVNSTIADNESDDVGGGFSHSHEGNVTMVNSTVTRNSSYDHSGVDVRSGNFTAVYSDIVGNVTGVSSENCGVNPTSVDDDGSVGPATIQAANVFVNENFNFYVFGTVIAQPGNADNCATFTTSSGYNFADDESCGLTQPTDRQGAGLNPKLGGLAANGGPTQTLLPQTGSPLIDAIPTADCAGGNALAGGTITTDQRGVARPDVVNQKCDIGSVEVQTEKPAAGAVVVQPNFPG